MLDVGSNGVAMDVTQPAWPFSVARSVRDSAILFEFRGGGSEAVAKE